MRLDRHSLHHLRSTHRGVAPLVGLTTYVSIHASVKDATFRNVNAYQRYLVSIHASVKDATHADDVPDPDKNVSIHASVKDATYHFCNNGRRNICFNPRICKRCDSMFVKSFIDDTFKL